MSEMETAPPPSCEAMDHLLVLAQVERTCRNSPSWKTGMEDAIARHGEAVEALYTELYRLLDERGMIVVPKPRRDPVKNLRREIVARLKSELPHLVVQILDDFDPAKQETDGG